MRSLSLVVNLDRNSDGFYGSMVVSVINITYLTLLRPVLLLVIYVEIAGERGGEGTGPRI